MTLLTPEQIEKIPNLYEQEEVSDPTVHLKITCLNSYWLITECCQEEGMLAFGFAELIPGCGELGYISLEEIDALPYPVRVEEVNRPLSELKKEMGA
jgi:hypothetical protein